MSATHYHGSTSDSSTTTNSTTVSSSSNSTSAVSSSSNSTSSSSSSHRSSGSSSTSSTNSNNGSSSGSGSNRESAVRSNDPYPQVKWMWTAICGVVILLAIWYLLNLYKKRKRQNSKLANKESGRPYKPSKWDAIQVGARNSFIARGFPKWLYAPETLADALWTTIYFLVTVIITLYDGPWSMGQVNVSNAFGTIAYAQTPLIFFFAMKNNPISWLTGIPYQNLNYLHRASSRAMLVWSWLHTGLAIAQVKQRKQWADAYIIWGWVAMGVFTIMWLASFAIIRRKLHQLFFAVHIVMAVLYLVACYLHWATLGFWLYSCFVIWGFDRLLRFGRTIYYNRIWSQGRGECKIEILDDSCLRITAIRPGFKWGPGQHAFLTSPRLSKWGIAEAHPFTMVNVPNDAGEVIILARVYQGYTRQLTNSLTANKDKLIRCYLDGPYGSPHSLASYDYVTLVAGGTGIAPWTAHLACLLAERKPIRTSYIHIVWLIREATSVSWIAPFIEQTAEKLRTRSDLTVKFSLHVTRGQIPAQTEKHTSISDESASQASTPAIEEMPALTHKAEPVAADVTLAKTNKPDVLLSHEASKIVEWHQGRAIFADVFSADAQTCPEAMAVGVCGPFPLMESVRKGVREASTFRSVLRGQVPIDYIEETLGQ
ncbi:hypothetical protein J008_03688 [Cryptococcus neoformans]|nr:hypothetical protein C362_03342 [Cryptococcus neoformans var. grubii Bt1]OXG31279.1 hypothetical protein C367_01494 [Cryptococcus neoformans var. grubii Ze90-1]OXH31247.1 hypothetical protein J008_03688 [Cryptococcus neoformans var. grubii]